MADKTRNMVFKFDGANVSTQAFGREFIPLMANVYALVQACSDEEVRVVSIENNSVSSSRLLSPRLHLPCCASVAWMA